MSSRTAKRRVMFLYWGRRGAVTGLALEVQRAALLDDTIEPTLSVSRQSEAFASYAEFGPSLFPVDTFARGAGAATGLWRVGQIGRELRQRIARDGIEAVITLMPHVWTPFVIPHVHRAGAKYATIIHDAVPHPGDRTAMVQQLLMLDADRADTVLTLSETVKRQVLRRPGVAQKPVVALFHPDLDYARPAAPRRQPGGAFRLLWFGRIMPYKGLELFVEALEILRREGLQIDIGVYGEGALGDNAGRLKALGAEVVNRWLGEDEIAGVFARFDAVALSHAEASQSGVAAAAFGAGLPVVATPVGGLTEQVENGINGVLAAGPSAMEFAAAVKMLATDPQLQLALRRGVATRTGHSTARFVRALVDAVLGAPTT